jgi:hypothetical protein
VKSENYEAPSHAVFTILLSLRLYASSGHYISHDAVDVVINVIIVPTSQNFVLRYPSMFSFRARDHFITIHGTTSKTVVYSNKSTNRCSN